MHFNLSIVDEKTSGFASNQHGKYLSLVVKLQDVSSSFWVADFSFFSCLRRLFFAVFGPKDV